MKLSKPSISFFCPAYNDEKNLPILIPKAIGVLKQVSSQFEIVIIEDGSPDKTNKVADMLAEKYKPLVRVIHHKKNKGYGAALKRGFLEANKYSYVCYTDGDLQFDIADYKKMIPYLSKYDAVIGFRKKRTLSKQRLLQTIVYNLMVRVLFNTRVKDINCSMKIVKRSVMNQIKLNSDSPFLDAELLINLQRKKVKMKQVPVTHFQRLYGKASGGNPSIIIDTFKEMCKFRLGSNI
jgi:glycosyltransferase involved in cell wall biosynthesis